MDEITLQVTQIGRDLMLTSLLLCAPVVVVSLLVGLLISIGQTITSIQEQTLTFAPRICAVVAIVIFLTPWYLTTISEFTSRMMVYMHEMIR